MRPSTLICHGQEVTTAIREHLVKFQTQGTLLRGASSAGRRSRNESGCVSLRPHRSGDDSRSRHAPGFLAGAARARIGRLLYFSWTTRRTSSLRSRGCCAANGHPDLMASRGLRIGAARGATPLCCLLLRPAHAGKKGYGVSGDRARPLSNAPFGLEPRRRDPRHHAGDGDRRDLQIPHEADRSCVAAGERRGFSARSLNSLRTTDGNDVAARDPATGLPFVLKRIFPSVVVDARGDGGSVCLLVIRIDQFQSYARNLT